MKDKRNFTDLDLCFPCIGDPEPDVLWFRGDKEVKPKKHDKRIKMDWDMKTDLYTLTIKEAVKDDAGDYTVKAVNKFGSFTFTVTVLVGRPEGAKIVETTRTTTSVQETIIDGEVVDRVEKKDVQVDKADEVDVEKTMVTATVDEAKVEVSETTAVSATQEVVEEFVEETKVKETEVKEPKEDKRAPKIVIPPEPTVVDVGEMIRLTCKVSG